MATVDEKFRAVLEGIWNGIERTNQEREKEEIATDPKKHKLTRMMADGKESNYRYFQTRNGKGQKTLFCWSVHRNAAGYFLGWRETYFKGKGKNGQYAKRDKWIARKAKAACKKLAIKRQYSLTLKYPEQQ